MRNLPLDNRRLVRSGARRQRRAPRLRAAPLLGACRRLTEQHKGESSARPLATPSRNCCSSEGRSCQSASQRLTNSSCERAGPWPGSRRTACAYRRAAASGFTCVFEQSRGVFEPQRRGRRVADQRGRSVVRARSGAATIISRRALSPENSVAAARSATARLTAASASSTRSWRSSASARLYQPCGCLYRPPSLPRRGFRLRQARLARSAWQRGFAAMSAALARAAPLPSAR